MVAFGPCRDGEQDGGLLRHRQQAFDQLYGRGVRPVEVLEGDHEWTVLRQAFEEVADDFERPVLKGLGRQLGEARCRIGLHGQTEHGAQVWVDLQRSGAEQSVHVAAQGDADSELRFLGSRAQPLPDEVSEGPIGKGLSVGDAPALEPK
jgi:hypothetical protein